jgi:hypothetical protein
LKWTIDGVHGVYTPIKKYRDVIMKLAEDNQVLTNLNMEAIANYKPKYKTVNDMCVMHTPLELVAMGVIPITQAMSL